MENYKFPLIDIVLYAKNQYKRSCSIWYDMALCLWAIMKMVLDHFWISGE